MKFNIKLSYHNYILSANRDVVFQRFRGSSLKLQKSYARKSKTILFYFLTNRIHKAEIIQFFLLIKKFVSLNFHVQLFFLLCDDDDDDGQSKSIYFEQHQIRN